MLDRKRGYNQINEALVLLQALTGKITAWRNHPAAVMWEHHIGGLCQYSRVVCAAFDPSHPRRSEFNEYDGPLPPWVGSVDFHRAHRANLTRKLGTYYSKLWGDPASDIYVWPKSVDGIHWDYRWKTVGAKGYHET